MIKLVVDIAADPATWQPLTVRGDVRVESVVFSTEPRDLPLDLIHDADILICRTPPTNHAQMRGLKLIQLSSVGYAQLYGLDLVKRGVRAANARGVYDTAIAEWNVAMMINLGRDVRGMLHHQDQ